MDSIRRRRINKRQKPDHEGEDMISNLPDFIIGRILSFLPTKVAVRTSVLSKRWKYMWTFITEVEIADRESLCRKRIRKTPFYNFVDNVLLHLKSSSIQSFSLSLSESYRHCRVDKWISDILNLRVKELYIDSKTKLDISGHTLLKSQSLEVLVLKMSLLPTTIRVPTFVCLSSLTVLKFYGITFTCDPFNHLQMQSLNFPVLREYETANCSWSHVKGVTFEVPLLEVLSISHTYFPMCQESHTIFKFCAPRLAEFSYTGHLLPDTNLLDLSTARIASAYINVYQYMSIGESEEKKAFLACELLKKFNNNVEYLAFEWPKVLALAPNDVPAFGMLSSLELGFVNGEILLIILRNTPFLKTLILKGLYQFDEELSNSDNVPSCFMSNLQVLYFGGILGEEHELCFAKFVLENAQVLELADFSGTWKLVKANYEDVKEKILSFKRSNRFAVIEFSSYSY